MLTFDIGETVICSCEIKDDSGNYKDPTTSMKITIKRVDPTRASVVTDTAMTPDSTGKYHYDCQTVDYPEGKYEITYTATDGTRITIEKETFKLG